MKKYSVNIMDKKYSVEFATTNNKNRVKWYYRKILILVIVGVKLMSKIINLIFSPRYENN